MARVIFFVLVAPLLFAQTTGTVEGRVVSSVTHSPINGVAVTLENISPRNQATYRATTDVSGLFRITDVAEATYSVHFSKSGWRQDIANPVKPVRVVNGETIQLSIELVLLGILRGRVVDGEGRPVGRARIELAHMRGASAAVTATDGDGCFELSESGTFTLMARPVAGQEAPKRSSSEEERTAWAPTYFPRGIQRAEAARIVLRPGEVLDGYEIRLRDVPVYRVRGVVLNEDGKPAPGVQVRIIAPDQWNGAAEAQVISDRHGAFEFDSVWARDWKLEAQAKRGEAVLKGYGSAFVSHHHVDEVAIRLSPPFAMNGFVEGLDLRDEKRDRRIIVLLFTQIGGGRSGIQMEDGIVRIKDVYPGRYTIVPFNIHPGYYLDSVFLGVRDVTGQAVDLLDGSVPIRVILKPNPGRVRGKVENCLGQTVVLWWLDEPILYTEYFRRTTCDADGRFEFTGLRPGDYYACAFSQVGDPYLLEDLAFARALKQRATKLRVEKGQTADVDLQLLPWPE